MKNNIWTIMKKEFARFFGDRRMVFTTILMPGLIIYVMYSFMGDALGEQMQTSDDYTYRVAAEEMPDSIEALTKKLHIEYLEMDEQKAKQQIADGTLDLYIGFPKDFDQEIAEYEADSQEPAPNVVMYYNSSETESNGIYNMLCEILDRYESSMTNKFDINAGIKDADQASDEDISAKLFSSLLPMLLMIFIYSGCASVAPECIAGEKERGTIATLLVTPVKRSQIALGKILSLSVIGLLSGCSSFLGVMLSLPKLLGVSEMNTNVYQIRDYILLLCIILTTVIVIVSVLAALSGLAKSVKEASTMVLPVMILVMVAGISGMIPSAAATGNAYYMIPLYNSVQCMKQIFAFEANTTIVLITVISNLVYGVIAAAVLTRLFDSEKMMYI